MINLKPILSMIALSVAVLSFTSCSSDDGGDDVVVSANVNSNLANANPFSHRMECPRLGSNSLLLTHVLSDGEVNYIVEWDTLKMSNRWTCYELYSSNREAHTKRYYADEGEEQYPRDPLLPARFQWRSDPFRRSGFDHGHLCPSADRLSSREANVQTFYLTNMMPQSHQFNAGIWADMEAWVRNQISIGSRDTLYVVKGGTIDKSSLVARQKVHGMVIPKYYYMALLMKNASGYKAMGFWIKHDGSENGDLSDYVVNIDELEAKTGIDFFCNLPDNIENQKESLPRENLLRAWGFTR